MRIVVMIMRKNGNIDLREVQAEPISSDGEQRWEKRGLNKIQGPQTEVMLKFLETVRVV